MLGVDRPVLLQFKGGKKIRPFSQLPTELRLYALGLAA
jgi:hypothetical protein